MNVTDPIPAITIHTPPAEASLASIAASLAKIAERFEPICFCGEPQSLHIPKCTGIRCQCEKFTSPELGLARVARLIASHMVDLKMVIAIATGQVQEADGENNDDSRIVKPH